MKRTCDSGHVVATPAVACCSGGRRLRQADVAATRVAHELAHTEHVSENFDDAGGGSGHLQGGLGVDFW